MVKTLSFLLLLSFSWQISGRLHTLLLFKLNEKKIVTELCENKNIPSKKCEGKCFLKKEFKKETEKEQKQASTVKDYLETLICTNGHSFKITLHSIRFNYPLISFSAVSGRHNAVFHPPAIG
jgi:hypothetical protein